MRAWTQVPARGRRFVITGANTGLCLATAQILGSRGAEVVIAYRDTGKGGRRRARSRATGLARRLWERSVELTGVDGVTAR